MIQRFGQFLFSAAIVLLPWQTQWIITRALIDGEPSSYGILSLYVVEVMIAFAFLIRWRREADIEVRKTWQALYYFLAVAFFSLSFSSILGVGWFHLLHVISAAMLYFLLTDSRTDIRRVLVLFLLGLIVPILVGWFQVLHGSSGASTLLGMGAKEVSTAGIAVVETDAGRLLRAYGTFPHPNIFGGYVAFGIVALAWLARFVTTKRQLVGALLASGVLGATLIVTFSRSAWLGLFVGFFVLMGLMLWQRKVPPRRAIPIMALGLASILSTLIVFHAQVFTRLIPTQRLEVISIEERASQYQSFGEVFLSAPILGVGPGAYPFSLSILDPGHPVWSYQPIHNTFLLILAELGVVGFALFFFWIYKMDLLTHARKTDATGMFAMTLGTVVLVIGLFDHYLWSLWPGLALGALVLGTMVAIVSQTVPKTP